MGRMVNLSTADFTPLSGGLVIELMKRFLMVIRAEKQPVWVFQWFWTDLGHDKE